MLCPRLCSTAQPPVVQPHHRHRRSRLRATASSPPSWAEADEEALLDNYAQPLSAEGEQELLASQAALEWPALLQQVGRFCATSVGRDFLLREPLAADRAASEALLAETAAALALETQYCVSLEFGGLDTRVASDAALKLASPRLALSSLELLSLAQLQQSLADLQRGLRTAGAPQGGSGEATAQSAPELAPLRSAALGVAVLPSLATSVRAAVEDNGRLRDSASDGLRKARTSAATAEARARRQLRGAAPKGAEVVPHLGRLCLQLAPGERCPEGWLLLGVAVPESGDGPPDPLSPPSLLAEPPECVAASSALQAALEQCGVEEHAVRLRLSDLFRGCSADVSAQLRAVARLDAAAARARHAAAVNGCQPSLQPSCASGASVLSLKHPLLLERLEGPFWDSHRSASSPPLHKRVVPVDILAPAGARVLLVSGANAGGKTAAAKAFALACLGARAGLFTCAASARLPWFDRVLVDVGEAQSLEKGLSTFSGRMRRLAALLRCATPRSLLLLDELGAGTSPTEGAALATALLEACAAGSVAGMTVATSHSGALKALKHRREAQFLDGRAVESRAVESRAADAGAFENAAAEFDAERLEPTHRLLWGLPGRSRALEMALRGGLPPQVVHDARALLGESALSFEELLSSLEQQRRRRREDEEAIRAASESARESAAAVAASLARLDTRRAQLARLNAKHVQRLAASASAAVADSQRSAKREAKAAVAAEAAQAAAEQARAAAEAAAAAEASRRAVWVPRAGETVRVKMPSGAVAQGVLLSAAGGVCSIRMGSLVLRANRADCQPAAEQMQTKATAKPRPRAAAGNIVR